MEKVDVGLFSRGDPVPGRVRFSVGRCDLDPRQDRPGEALLTFEQVQDEVVGLFKGRHPKLRVKDMP